MVLLFTGFEARAQFCDPIADFTFVNSGLSTQFQFTSATSGGSHTWTFGDIANGTSTAVNPNYAYDVNGLYPVGSVLQVTHCVNVSGVTYCCTQVVTITLASFPCSDFTTHVRYFGDNCAYQIDVQGIEMQGDVTYIEWQDNTTTTGTGAATYTHTYAASFIGQTLTIAIHFVAGGQQYTCYVTILVACGCSDPTFGMSCDFDPCIGVTATFEDHCDNSNSCLHFWDFGDGITAGPSLASNTIVGVLNTSGTFGNPVHIYTPPFTNANTTVTHFIDCNGTVVSATNNCTAPIPANTFFVGTNQASVTDIDATIFGGAGATSVQGATIIVEGELTVDRSFNFDNCHFFMKPGASIRAALTGHINPTNLVFKGCTLEGCDRMWRGIILNSSTSLGMFGSRVFDAQYAIEFNNANQMSLVNNRFERCYAGVYTAPAAAQKNIVALIMRQNVFNCEAQVLLPAYPGQTPLPFSFTRVGILINNVSSFVLPNNTLANANVFRHINNGIEAYNVSNLSIQGCLFRDILEAGQVTWGIPNGYAITHKNPDIPGFFNHVGYGSDVIPGTTFTTTFEHCIVGIATEWVETNISNTAMNSGMGNTDFMWGIRVQNTTAGQGIWILENDIRGAKYGIDLKDVGSSDAIEVAFNDIASANFIDAIEFNAIRATGMNEWCPTCRRAIHHNAIGAMERGINVNNLDLMEVSNNNIQVLPNNPPQMLEGVCMKNSSSTVTSCNTVVAEVGENNAATGNNHTAYRFVQTSNAAIRCNDADNTRTAYRLGGVIGTAELSGNHTRRHNIGINIIPNTSIGPQNHRGNLWHNIIPSPAILSNAVGNTLWQVHVAASNPTFGTPTFHPLGAQGSFFNPFLTPGTPFSCDIAPFLCTTADPIGLFPFAALLDSTSVKIAEGEPFTTEFPMENLWVAQQQLMQTLRQNEALVAQDSSVALFYENAEASPLGELQDISEGRAELAKLTEAQHNEKEDYQTDGENLLAQFSLITDNSDTSEAAIALMMTQIATLNTTTYDAYLTERIAWQTGIAANKATLAQSLAYDNGNIDDDEMMVFIEKYVNELYLDASATRNFNFTTEQDATLGIIAHQCPVAGGVGVGRARTLYELAHPFEIYDDEGTCAAAGYNYMMSLPNGSATQPQPKQPATKLTTTLQVLPNPASDYINVTLSGITANSATLIMRDAQGKTVETWLLPVCNNGAIVLPIANITIGVYTLSAVADKHPVAIQRIVIIR